MTPEEQGRDAVGSWRLAIDTIRRRMIEDCGDPPLRAAEIWPNHPRKRQHKGQDNEHSKQD